MLTKHLPKLPPILLILGAVVRIIGAGSAAIWYDEAVVLYRSGLPFMQLFSNQSDLSGDLLIDLLVRPLMAISHSLWLLRLPSLLAGLASLWLVWKLMRRLNFSLPQQVLTAAFVAFIPGLIWTGQDARSYSLVGLLLLGALWFALESRWLGLLACCGLMPYAHSTAVLYAGAALIVAAYMAPWSIKRVLATGFLSGLAWAPALLRILIYRQVPAALQPWSPQLTLNWFFRSIIQATWTTTLSTVTAAAIMLMLLLLTLPLLFTPVREYRRTLPLLAWLLPFAGMVLISLRQNILLYRTVMPMLWPFGLWMGWELGYASDRLKLRRGFRLALLILWVSALNFGLWGWNAAARGADLDRAAAWIRSQWRTGDLVVYATRTTELPFLYYIGDLPHYQYPHISSNFLEEPGIHLPDTGDPAAAGRIWLVLPRNEMLVTPAELAAIDAAYPHGPALLRLEYLQAAPIEIYLEEDK
jgi:hypothetical protein